MKISDTICLAPAAARTAMAGTVAAARGLLEEALPSLYAAKCVNLTRTLAAANEDLGTFPEDLDAFFAQVGEVRRLSSDWTKLERFYEETAALHRFLKAQAMTSQRDARVRRRTYDETLRVLAKADGRGLGTLMKLRVAFQREAASYLQQKGAGRAGLRRSRDQLAEGRADRCVEDALADALSDEWTQLGISMRDCVSHGTRKKTEFRGLLKKSVGELHHTIGSVLNAADDGVCRDASSDPGDALRVLKELWAKHARAEGRAAQLVAHQKLFNVHFYGGLSDDAAILADVQITQTPSKRGTLQAQLEGRVKVDRFADLRVSATRLRLQSTLWSALDVLGRAQRVWRRAPLDEAFQRGEPHAALQAALKHAMSAKTTLKSAAEQRTASKQRADRKDQLEEEDFEEDDASSEEDNPDVGTSPIGTPAWRRSWAEAEAMAARLRNPAHDRLRDALAEATRDLAAARPLTDDFFAGGHGAGRWRALGALMPTLNKILDSHQSLDKAHLTLADVGFRGRLTVGLLLEGGLSQKAPGVAGVVYGAQVDAALRELARQVSATWPREQENRSGASWLTAANRSHAIAEWAGPGGALRQGLFACRQVVQAFSEREPPTLPPGATEAARLKGVGALERGWKEWAGRLDRGEGLLDDVLALVKDTKSLKPAFAGGVRAPLHIAQMYHGGYSLLQRGLVEVRRMPRLGVFGDKEDIFAAAAEILAECHDRLKCCHKALEIWLDAQRESCPALLWLDNAELVDACASWTKFSAVDGEHTPFIGNLTKTLFPAVARLAVTRPKKQLNEAVDEAVGAGGVDAVRRTLRRSTTLHAVNAKRPPSAGRKEVAVAGVRGGDETEEVEFAARIHLNGSLADDVRSVQRALRRAMLEGVFEALATESEVEVAPWPLDRVDTSFPAAGAVLAASAAWTREVEGALRHLGGPARHEAFREALEVGGNVKFDLMKAAQPDERRRTVVGDDDERGATDDAEELQRRAFADEASRADDRAKAGAHRAGRRGIGREHSASAVRVWRQLEHEVASRVGRYVAALASRPGARRVLAAQALVSQGVLQRDVAQLMRAYEVASPEDFEWAFRPKHRWEAFGEDRGQVLKRRRCPLLCEAAGLKESHGLSYTSPGACRLFVAPLSHRSLLAFSASVNEGWCGARLGPGAPGLDGAAAARSIHDWASFVGRRPNVEALGSTTTAAGLFLALRRTLEAGAATELRGLDSVPVDALKALAGWLEAARGLVAQGLNGVAVRKTLEGSEEIPDDVFAPCFSAPCRPLLALFATPSPLPDHEALRPLRSLFRPVVYLEPAPLRAAELLLLAKGFGAGGALAVVQDAQRMRRADAGAREGSLWAYAAASTFISADLSRAWYLDRAVTKAAPDQAPRRDTEVAKILRTLDRITAGDAAKRPSRSEIRNPTSRMSTIILKPQAGPSLLEAAFQDMEARAPRAPKTPTAKAPPPKRPQLRGAASLRVATIAETDPSPALKPRSSSPFMKDKPKDKPELAKRRSQRQQPQTMARKPSVRRTLRSAASSRGSSRGTRLGRVAERQ